METTQLKKLEVLHEQAKEFPTIQEEIKKAWCSLAIPYFNYDHNLSIDTYYFRAHVEPFNIAMAEEINTIVQEYKIHANQETVNGLLCHADRGKNTLKIAYCAEKKEWEKELYISYSKENALCTFFSCTRQELLTNTIPGFTYTLQSNGKIVIKGDVEGSIAKLVSKWPMLTWDDIRKVKKETEQKLKKALNIPEQE